MGIQSGHHLATPLVREFLPGRNHQDVQYLDVGRFSDPYGFLHQPGPRVQRTSGDGAPAVPTLPGFGDRRRLYKEEAVRTVEFMVLTLHEPVG